MTTEASGMTELRTPRTEPDEGGPMPDRSPQLGMRGLFVIVAVVMVFAVAIVAVMYLLPGVVKG